MKRVFELKGKTVVSQARSEAQENLRIAKKAGFGKALARNTIPEDKEIC